jgi:thiol-disulfide isomerase/thioredoxin
MKRNIIAILMLFLGLAAFAQQHKLNTVKRAKLPAHPRNLQIGDTVPDIYVPKIINADKRSLNLSDFKYKDKLLIIDFWATTCDGCVAALPKLEALEKEFGSEVKILLATSEPELLTSEFLKKDKVTKDKSIPSVVDDKTLSKWFNYKFVSHDVWIYQGKVVAFTDPQYVTAANIKLVLSGAKYDFPVKNDMQPDFSNKATFLQVNQGQYNWKQGPVKYAALFGYRDMTSWKVNLPGSDIDTVRHTVRHYFVNLSISSAYTFYWEMIRHPGGSYYESYTPSSRFIYEVQDTAKFLPDVIKRKLKTMTNREWDRTYKYCFESVMPYTGQSIPEQAKAVIADLDHLFNAHGRWEKRRVKCLVIVQKETDDKVKEKWDLAASQYGYIENKTGRYNETARDKQSKAKGIGTEVLLDMRFLTRCSNLSKTLPFVSEATYKGTILLPPASMDDLASLQKGLQASGFDLVEAERETDMFIITETKTD